MRVPQWGLMVIGRSQRRNERRQRVENCFSEPNFEAVLDLLELLEISWHNCYGEITPSEEIVDDVLLLSGGDLAELIQAVHLAVTDWRDLTVNAATLRNLAN